MFQSCHRVWAHSYLAIKKSIWSNFDQMSFLKMTYSLSTLSEACPVPTFANAHLKPDKNVH